MRFFSFEAIAEAKTERIRDYGGGALNHGQLLRYLHIDSDTFRRVIETLVQSEIIAARPLSRRGFRYTLL